MGEGNPMDFVQQHAGIIVGIVGLLAFVFATIIEPRLGTTYNDEQEASDDNEE